VKWLQSAPDRKLVVRALRQWAAHQDKLGAQAADKSMVPQSYPNAALNLRELAAAARSIADQIERSGTELGKRR
jgi:hypothetical protein